MGKLQRLMRIVTGLLTLICAIILLVLPVEGYVIVVVIASISLALYGLKSLIYYFTMARHMVEGRMLLYKAVILLDLGLFAMTLTDVPTFYIILYLAGTNIFSGVVDILRGMESKKLAGGHWKRKVLSGAISVAFSLSCLFSLSSVELATYLFAAGLLFSGAERIASAFKKTAIVYIQ